MVYDEPRLSSVIGADPEWLSLLVQGKINLERQSIETNTPFQLLDIDETQEGAFELLRRQLRTLGLHSIAYSNALLDGRLHSLGMSGETRLYFQETYGFVWDVEPLIEDPLINPDLGTFSRVLGLASVIADIRQALQESEE